MEKQWLYQPHILIAIVLLFFVQQIMMTHDSRARTIDPYATTTKTLTDSSYYNHKLAKKLIILKTKDNKTLSIVSIICQPMHLIHHLFTIIMAFHFTQVFLMVTY